MQYVTIIISFIGIVLGTSVMVAGLFGKQVPRKRYLITAVVFSILVCCPLSLWIRILDAVMAVVLYTKYFAPQDKETDEKV